jgi:hypothetical protein
MDTLIAGLPLRNNRIVRRARFYERNNEGNITIQSGKKFSRNTVGTYNDWLVYRTEGNKMIWYRGRAVFVKEIVLDSDKL